MKNPLFFSCILLFAVSCSSSSSDDDPEPVVSEKNLPGDYVFTKDESIFEQDPSVARYSYIYTNKSAMFRDDILKTYPLSELVKEEHCLFTVAESQCDGPKKCYTIQLADDPELFLSAGSSSNKEEVHLFIFHGEKIVPVGSPSYYSPGDDSDEARFYFHQAEDVKGVRTYAIECVGMPGWYLSDTPPGFNYAANIMTLQKENNPEGAPKWQVRSVN